MTSNIYTLSEMVDLALMTPEKGAVNFNVLRVLIHKILSECDIQNVTTEWKPVFTPISKALYKEELPDHPIYRGIKEDSMQKEEELKPGSSMTVEGFIDESYEGKYESEETPIESVAETVSDSELTGDKKKRRKKKEKAMKDKRPITNWRNLKAGADIWSAWQLKKMEKKIEALEEEINSIVVTVDEIQEWVDTRKNRPLFEEGGKLQGQYTGSVNRTEFEDAIEDIGEALTRITRKQAKQKEDDQALHQNILNELCQKIPFEELKKSKEELSKKINIVSMAVRNMQELIKNVIYPDSCGITKCMACNRKAHLPIRGMVSERRKEILKKETNNDYVSPGSSPRRKPESPHDLRFTAALLAKARSGADFKPQEDEQFSENVADQKQRHQEKSFFPEYLVKMEEFDCLEFSLKDFAPLRFIPKTMRPNEIYTPSVRANQVSVSVGGDDSNISIRRCVRR